MNTDTHTDLESVKLSTFSRLARLTVGALMLAIAMTQSEVLGTVAILPLLAIYPILSGILGYGLLELLFINQHRIERPTHLVMAARASLFVLGASLIAFAMASETALSWLALLAIFPVLMALLGSDLLGEAMATRRALQDMRKTVVPAGKARLINMPRHTAATQEHHPKQAA